MTSTGATAFPRARKTRRPYSTVSFWILPMIAIAVVGMLGTALYLGGLSSPAKHFKDFPIALVNLDTGATVPTSDGKTKHQNLGGRIADEFANRAGEDDQIDLRRVSWNEAKAQLDRGEVYAAVVIPRNFSAETTSLVEGTLTQKEATQPHITLFTEPQAGSIGTRLATEAVEPGITEASKRIGEELTASLPRAEQQAHDRVLAQLRAGQQEQSEELARSAAQGGPQVQQFAQQVQQAQEGSAERIAEKLSPTASSDSRALLADPVKLETTAHRGLQEGTALGMGAFYYSILLIVVGLSGSVALNVLMDGRLGLAPMELGPSFKDHPRRTLGRLSALFMKWATFTVAAAPTSALMMWMASLVEVPLPHGWLLFLVGWLALSTVSAVVLTLITLGGSAGMLLSMIYLVFMGLPSAGAVIPLQAVPEFFRAIAPIEPLHHIYLAVRAVLYFDADPYAGLQEGVIALAVILTVMLVIGALGGLLYDRFFGRRGDRPGRLHGVHAGQPEVESVDNPPAVAASGA